MKSISFLLLAVSVLASVAACGGATAERAKDDVNGAGGDLRAPVSNSPEAIKNDAGGVDAAMKPK